MPAARTAGGGQAPASPSAQPAPHPGGRGQRVQLAAPGATARAHAAIACGWPATAARPCLRPTGGLRPAAAGRPHAGNGRLPGRRGGARAERHGGPLADHHRPDGTRSRKEDREQCLAAGMDDFLAKPIQAADLWAAIDRVVGAGPTRRAAGARTARPAGAPGGLRRRRRHPGEDLSGVSGVACRSI